MAFAPSPVTTWWRSPKRGSASRCMRHRWGACYGGSGCRGRSRGPAIRGRTRPPKRPLKRAPRTLQRLHCTHNNKRLRLYFQDEARNRQKRRLCHISWKRGERPRGILDQRYTNAYIYAAIEPGTDNNFVLILPDANTAGMQAFLDAFAATIAEDEHVALVVDGAGWHGSKSLNVPC